MLDEFLTLSEDAMSIIFEKNKDQCILLHDSLKNCQCFNQIN